MLSKTKIKLSHQWENRRILQRLANYHHAKLFVYPYICFNFKCGNEYLSWDKTAFFDSENCWIVLPGSKKISNETDFLNNYMNMIMFEHKLNDDISRDFIDFKKNMIKATSISELKIKLDILGF